MSERRIVTAIFCDISGSTSAAEQLDPEEWSEIMNGAFERMIVPINRYEGTVIRLLGDAVLAFFGAPIAHEDDPQRAVRTGLEIQQAMGPYLSEVRRNWGVNLDVRCGINTGLAVVGAVGSEAHVEYTALGDAVNVAARMEQTARPGTVQISDATYRLVAPFFDVEKLGGIEVKGKSEPVSGYRVLGVRAAPGRIRGIEGLESRLVGREADLARLREAVARLMRGAGGIVFLTGEAGLGKSRLIREVRITSAEKYPELRWYGAGGLSYEMARPYGLFQRLMRNVCAIGEDATPQEIRQGIERILEDAPAEHRVPTQKVLEALFDYAEHSVRSPRVEGETFKGQLYVTMHALWSAWGSADPVALVFDDLHWADPGSLALLEHLFTVIDNAPLLIICAMRPDIHAPGWSLKLHAQDRLRLNYQEINLRSLSSDDSSLLIDNLISADLPNNLRTQVLDKSTGNPLFVEEVVRTLIDSGVLIRDKSEKGWLVSDNLDMLHIPNSIQALLMARIDRLEQGVRQTLQFAAVIGRSFSFRVLSEISHLNRTVLGQQLSTLQQADLISEAASGPELEYTFRQTLVQETAYNAILHQQRREIHRRVGATLEKLFADRLEEHAVVLAYHFDEARQYDRACRYHSLAGDAAYRLYSLEEAISHYDRALELAQQQDDSDQSSRSDLLQHLYLRKGRALELTGKYARAVATYDELSELGDRLASPPLQLASLLARGTIASTITPVADAALGETIDDEALSLARALGDRRSEARALWNLMNLHNFQLGVMEEAARYGEEAMSIALDLNLDEQLAYIQNDLHWIYIHLGDFPRAWTLLEESRKRWRRINNLPMLVDNLFGTATYYVFTGELDKALEVCQEGTQIAQSIRNVWNQAALRGTMAIILRQRGEYGTAITSLEQTANLVDDGSPGIHASFLSMLLALFYAESGMVERGLALFEQTKRRFDKMTLTFRMTAYHAGIEARLHLLNENVPAAQKAIQAVEVSASGSDLFSILGHFNPFVQCELALANGEYMRAKQLAQEFSSAYNTNGARWALPEFRYWEARAVLGLGDRDRAETTLRQARDEAAEMGLRRIHWPILLDLAELEAERGNYSAAEELREEADNIREYIAAGLPEAELRRAFLGR